MRADGILGRFRRKILVGQTFALRRKAQDTTQEVSSFWKGCITVGISAIVHGSSRKQDRRFRGFERITLSLLTPSAQRWFTPCFAGLRTSSPAGAYPTTRRPTEISPLSDRSMRLNRVVIHRRNRRRDLNHFITRRVKMLHQFLQETNAANPAV